MSRALRCHVCQSRLPAEPERAPPGSPSPLRRTQLYAQRGGPRGTETRPPRPGCSPREESRALRTRRAPALGLSTARRPRTPGRRNPPGPTRVPLPAGSPLEGPARRPRLREQARLSPSPTAPVPMSPQARRGAQTMGPMSALGSTPPGTPGTPGTPAPTARRRAASRSFRTRKRFPWTSARTRVLGAASRGPIRAATTTTVAARSGDASVRGGRAGWVDTRRLWPQGWSEAPCSPALSRKENGGWRAFAAFILFTR